MHINYYFFYQLTKSLAEALKTNWRLGLEEHEIAITHETPATLEVCFSQHKDELVLGFALPQNDFYLRANLESELSILSFPQEYARAKKNSIDLFTELQGKSVIMITQYLNERAFSIDFEDNFVLLFKMYGRRANVILFQNDEFIISFHKKMETDKYLIIKELDRYISQDFETFVKYNGDGKKIFPTFGKEVNQYLKQFDLSTLSLEQQWQKWIEVKKIIENPTFYIYQPDGFPLLSLLPPKNQQEKIFFQSKNPIQIANDFFVACSKTTVIRKEKGELIRNLQRKQRQSQTYIEKNESRLSEIADTNLTEQTAHLIMANLHQIPQNVEKFEVFDFYNNQNKIIKLKKDLSPQKNAEIYYRKAKNEKIELENLQKNLQKKYEELNQIEKHLLAIEKIDNLKELRKYAKENQLMNVEKEISHQDTLFKKFYYQNFEIWVGKNAKNNDLLTQKYAYKEDLWLHAKDVSGSHVIIKYQAGKPFPKDVIEKAASLAAYYSKRSNDSLCPVIFTPKKFVRKTKDLAEGQVIVEKEEVLMVIPEKFNF
jgi:predicted ribosome quality control (RQC) complex YloA/Tae2 family protein